jgi:hypothetical protein
LFVETLWDIETDPWLVPVPGCPACTSELVTTLRTVTDTVNMFLKLRCMIRPPVKKLFSGRQLICPSTSAKRVSGRFVTALVCGFFL